jgi:iron complex outermembrane receptor protein
MKCKIITIIVVISCINLSAQTDTIKLQEIEVNTNRISTTYKDNLRLVQIITAKEIQQMPVTSVNEALDYMNGVDVRQRGVNGVQADVSIRGGNNEQTLIMVNGIPVNDPQTGHHSLNIPVKLSAVERIEVLSGSDARNYGANAFSGAINIVTKQTDENSLSFGLSGGDFNYLDGFAQGTFHIKKTQHLITISHSQSDGYMNNTDFKYTQGMWQANRKWENGFFQTIVAIEDKAFGANSFYTPVYPNQFEETRTLFSALTFHHYWEKQRWVTQLYYRQNQDRFELFRHDLPASQIPAWYKGHNYHLTQVIGGQTNTSFNTSLGKTTVGMDYRFEHIYSNVLGEPMNDTIPVPFESNGKFTRASQKSYLSAFIDHSLAVNHWNFSTGLLMTYLSANHFYFYPGLDAGYKFNEHLTVFSSISRSLRLPTYTELYYQDAASIGNINLKPEEALNSEIGFKYNKSALSVQTGCFYRAGKNIIDWVKLSSTDKWHSENITEVNTYGADVSAIYHHTSFHPNSILKQISVNYSYINITKQSGDYYSKYAMDVLRHKISVSVEHKIIRNFSASWKVLYHERMGTYTDYPSGLEKKYNPYLTVDAKLNYHFKLLDFYIEGTNLFNSYYYDIANIPMPGRWVKCGITINLGF